MSETIIKKIIEKDSVYLDYFNLTGDFSADFIYNSLLFENDNISLEEVKEVISSKENPSDKRKIIIRNHYGAFLFTLAMVKNNVKLDENKIKDIHELLMSAIGIGGLYRNVDISIKGSNHTPPSYMKVYNRMKKYITDITFNQRDIYQLIAYSHLQLVKIHPFLDGNGRCARLILLYFILKNNLKPIFIPYSDRNHYFSLLEEFKVNKNIDPFIKYIKKLINS